ncbi:MAG TPA: hypothetical protein VN670_03905 [Acidobacteriaceae bacterium]|nr:hypothetical protein [Acidobacteriaceae bacterium]
MQHGVRNFNRFQDFRRLGARGRKTMTAAAVSLLAKQGISNLDSIEAGSLDAALGALSIEQRIAVKSQLLRAGLLG